MKVKAERGRPRICPPERRHSAGLPRPPRANRQSATRPFDVGCWMLDVPLPPLPPIGNRQSAIGYRLSREKLVQSVPPFGFRPSDFFRTSAFGLRISGPIAHRPSTPSMLDVGCWMFPSLPSAIRQSSQSQRDCIPKPRVALRALPWVKSSKTPPTLKGLHQPPTRLPPAIGYRLSAIGYRLSPIGNRLSSPSVNNPCNPCLPSALGFRLSVFGFPDG